MTNVKMKESAKAKSEAQPPARANAQTQGSPLSHPAVIRSLTIAIPWTDELGDADKRRIALRRIERDLQALSREAIAQARAQDDDDDLDDEDDDGYGYNRFGSVSEFKGFEHRLSVPLPAAAADQAEEDDNHVIFSILESKPRKSKRHPPRGGFLLHIKAPDYYYSLETLDAVASIVRPVLDERLGAAMQSATFLRLHSNFYLSGFALSRCRLVHGQNVAVCGANDSHSIYRAMSGATESLKSAAVVNEDDFGVSVDCYDHLQLATAELRAYHPAVTTIDFLPQRADAAGAVRGGGDRAASDSDQSCRPWWAPHRLCADLMNGIADCRLLDSAAAIKKGH